MINLPPFANHSLEETIKLLEAVCETDDRHMIRLIRWLKQLQAMRTAFYTSEEAWATVRKIIQ